MKNWKTSLAGLIGALAMAAANYSGEKTWQGYIACLVPIVLGVLAKDFDTHSTETQVQTATAVAQAEAVTAANAVQGK